MMEKTYDVIVIGAGASGLMCASVAGLKGRKVLVLDHTARIAEKIRISGGGKCNFTNKKVTAQNYICSNAHFCKSALAQYSPQDFINLIEGYKIKYHEKTLGQLFCDGSAQEIIDMLFSELAKSKTEIKKKIKINSIERLEEQYRVETNEDTYICQSLVIATGGLSIPKIGASNFGYETAKKFGLNIIPPSPALVPLTFAEQFSELSGISIDAEVSCGKQSFKEGILFTHKGLSGPAILQISSYWGAGKTITVNLLPNIDAFEFLKEKKKSSPKQHIDNLISELLPKRLAQYLAPHKDIGNSSDKELRSIADKINNWQLTPTGTEGYKIAEVTKGGVDTDEISSKTFECKKHQGLFFIGEVLDVTGHLGGYNFQWAWSSGYVAGQNV